MSLQTVKNQVTLTLKDSAAFYKGDGVNCRRTVGELAGRRQASDPNSANPL